MCRQVLRAIPVLGVWIALLILPDGAVSAQSLSSSKHDFTTTGGTAPFNFADGLCITCHTPHNGATLAPLWGHDTTTVAAAGWTMYSSATMDATEPSKPANVSLACLSCHDGTVAVDAFGGSSGTTTRQIPTTSAAYLGNDLSNDHPISITYNAGGAEFNATAGAGFAGTAGVDSLPLYGVGQDKVECGSCHNPHDATGVTDGKFLRRNQAPLCTICHDKG